MIVNFCPSRNRISKELERCTSVENLERLLSFCSSCIYRIFEEARGMNAVPMMYKGDRRRTGGRRRFVDN